MNKFIFFQFIVSKALIINSPFLFGIWKLRLTNDIKLADTMVYLILDNSDKIKLKTITNGIFATKISKSGIIKKKVKNFSIFHNNKIELDAVFSRLNKYTYSIFGLEIPQIKLIGNETYNITKNVIITHKYSSLYIIDNNNKNYYIFDQFSDKLQIPSASLTFMLANQLIGFVVNLILVKLLHHD